MTADVSELERQARELLRPEVYEYYAGGSGGEVTLRANDEAWRRVRFLPRVLRDVSAVRTGVRLGHPLNLELRTPIAVAPTAFHRLAHPQGEIATASGAARAGALFVLSSRSTRRIEDVAAAVADGGGSWWFQVYLMYERELTARLVRRAAAAGAQALVLTADTPVVGRKARMPRDGLIDEPDFLVNLGPLEDLAVTEFVPVSLADIGWLGDISGGLPVVVKGVLRADDAAACLAAGAAAVIVSNHGGRQLDQAMPTALALPGRAGRRGGPSGVRGRRRADRRARAGRARAGRRAGVRGPPRAVGPGLRRGGWRAGLAGRPDRRPGPRHGAGGRRRAGRASRPDRHRGSRDQDVG